MEPGGNDRSGRAIFVVDRRRSPKFVVAIRVVVVFVFCRVELPTVVIPIFQASAMADEDADEYKDLLNWAASRGITDAPFVGDKPTSIRSTPSLGFSIRIATFPDAGG